MSIESTHERDKLVARLGPQTLPDGSVRITVGEQVVELTAEEGKAIGRE